MNSETGASRRGVRGGHGSGEGRGRSCCQRKGKRKVKRKRERDSERKGLGGRQGDSTIYGRLVVMVISRRERKGCSCQGDGAALGY